MGFTEPPGSPRALVRSYRTVSPLPVPVRAIGGLFSVALSCGSPRLGVTQHPALWSPDVPRTGHRERAGTRPPGRLTTITSVARPAPAHHPRTLVIRSSRTLLRGHDQGARRQACAT